MKTFKQIIQSICIEEKVLHDRYIRSHGKKAPNKEASWLFTTKRMGEVDMKNPKEFFQAPPFMKLSDAAKLAQDHFRINDVYVME